MAQNLPRFWGQVLWVDRRDGNGLIQDWDGNRFYFDESVMVERKDFARLRAGMIVRFQVNQKITECLCACFVTIPLQPLEAAKALGRAMAREAKKPRRKKRHARR